MARTVGIVLPAYAPDVQRLARYVREISAAIDPAAIRIELDAPTAAVVEDLAELPAQVNVAAQRRGKGAAITAGFEALTTDVLVFADADGSTPVDSLRDVITPVGEATVDLAVGSRRHPDATVRAHQTYGRRWLGHGFAWIARRLLDVKCYDYQCGAKAMTRAAWEAVRSHLYEPGFAWDIELIAMTDALGYEIREVPIAWDDQPGSTVAPLETAIDMARALITARHRARLLRDDPLHTALAAYRSDSTALVNQPQENDD